ncbi:IS4 family transposase [Pedobacter sp. SYP-B3415]|uniref:IS4 family transposase n=1 Tax=Pedobacter sp. SYP-B3415 TaxID=2496641 RepID=UPI00101CEC28|nr:IS4 family transposase [Pedobacter sp. SYP-B3415]
MPKSTFFTGQPILNQLLSLIPRTKVDQLAHKYQANRYCKKFKAYDHLVTMLFSSFKNCSSLRELITSLQANSSRLSHLGVKYTPRRSTLADANERRSAEMFSELFHFLRKRYYGFSPDSHLTGKIKDRLFIIDSTTVTLFSQVFKACGNALANGRRKGGVKAHTLIRSKDDVPCFVHITAASANDRTFMPKLDLPPGSILVMDKGYLSYHPMNAWTAQQITWVTRMNKGARWKLEEEQPVSDKHTGQGIIKDMWILLGNPSRATDAPVQKARIVVYHDKSSGREFQFLTNNRELGALTIAGIYKRRWQIESLFKRLKQNFQLHNFLGDNQNAVQIQLWCTLIADLLVKVIKDKADKKRKTKWSFTNVAGLIRHHLSTYIDILAFLIHPDKALLGYNEGIPDYQQTLFAT